MMAKLVMMTVKVAMMMVKVVMMMAKVAMFRIESLDCAGQSAEEGSHDTGAGSNNNQQLDSNHLLLPARS